MITYKDTLKLKLEKLQKAIDDISNINYGSLRIGGGVIVDMTVDNVNANSITTNILKVNNDVNLKNLSVDDLSVVNTITSKNAIINNTLKIFKPNSTSSANVELSLDNNYDLYIGGNAYGGDVYLSSYNHFYSDGVTYLYDRNGYLYFCKGTRSSGTTYVPRNNYRFFAEIFGFYDRKSNKAILSTSFTQCWFSNTAYNDYYFWFGFKVKNMYFKTIPYSLDSISTNWNNSSDSDYQRVRITGNAECSEIKSTISADALSTGERFYHSLFPSNFNILINNNTYSCYVIRTRSSGLMSSNNLHMMFKFTDVNCEYTTNTTFP